MPKMSHSYGRQLLIAYMCLGILAPWCLYTEKARAGSLTSACVNKSTGAVRVLINGGTCTTSEVPITWGHEVVDSSGKLIGSLIGFSEVLLQINGVWFDFGVEASGFVLTAAVSEALYEYPTSNCSGTAYIHGGDLIEFAAVFGTGPRSEYIVYGAPPFRQLTVNSTKCEGGACGTTNNQCEKFAPYQDTVGVSTQYSLSSLGFTPPFAVK